VGLGFGVVIVAVGNGLGAYGLGWLGDVALAGAEWVADGAAAWLHETRRSIATATANLMPA